MNPAKRQQIFERLRQHNPEPRTELHYSNAFELLIAVVLFAVHFLLTSVIETLLLGRTLDLSPFAIILSLTFWGLVWGVGGLFLAVPLTGALAIICRHLEGLEWFAELIAGSKPVRSRRRLRFGTR